MAHLEELLTEIDDADLRAAVLGEVKRLKRQVQFGLVFEPHLPETVLLNHSVAARVGDRVRLRKEPSNRAFWTVEVIKEKTATIAPTNGSGNGSTKRRQVPVGDLLVVRDFGDPIYPTLTSVGSVRRSKDRPSHAVINSENYHALQALLYAYEGQVDCLFLDPPYNTGAKDWTYNNDYVDGSDAYRHSKWLSFMEKRLRLAKRLLDPARSVMVVTVDEHEVSHLGLLLEQLFPEATRQMVTIVINPKGVTEERLSRVEEYAYFCFFGDAVVSGLGDDLLTPQTDDDHGESRRPRWKGLLRSGTNARRQDRKNMFYPVLIDPSRQAVLGVDEPLPLEEKPDFDSMINGLTPAWPVRKDGSLGNWGVGHITLAELIEQGYVKLGEYNEKRRSWGFSYLSRRYREQIQTGVLQKLGYDEQRNVVDVAYTDPQVRRVKRVWHRSSHDAGAGGSDLLRSFLGERRFAFPKSLYAVADALRVVTRENPDALIVDFFAGSGTTLHATLLLNTEDDGHRRCVLVTNNEVEAELAAKLHDESVFFDDNGFDKHGIVEAVCKPRCEAAITGRDPKKKPIAGRYLDGNRSYAEGFEDNCEFFRLDYLDGDDVELGRCFAGIEPFFWLRAGTHGLLPNLDPQGHPFAVVEESGYAVLFEERAFRDFVSALNDAPSVEHVFLRTDNEDSFAEMCTELGAGHRPEMLYRDYARFFRSFVSPSP